MISEAERRRRTLERKRRFRRRQAAGLIVIPITIDQVSAAAELIEAGWLAPQDEDDRDAIRSAIERAIVKILPQQ